MCDRVMLLPWAHLVTNPISSNGQKQPSRGVPRKRCYENMQQIYRSTLLKSTLLKQLYCNHTSAWMFSCKFAAYFQNNFY